MDVILDLVTLVEQQQFASIGHVPYQPVPGADARDAHYQLVKRRQQLQVSAARLRSGITTLSESKSIEAQFLSDLAQLRKDWPLGRHATRAAGGAGYFADLSIPRASRTVAGAAAGDEGGATLSSNGTPPADSAVYALVPDATGAACLVSPASNGARRLVKGVAAIDLELRRLLLVGAWRRLAEEVSTEVQQGLTWDNADGACSAVQRMVSKALGRAEGEAARDQKESFDAGAPGLSCGALAGAGLDAQDVKEFCAAPLSQLEFEQRALQLLAQVVKDATMPALVLEARGGLAQHRPVSVLGSLVGWVRHAALCRAANRLVRSQAEVLGVNVRELPANSELSAAWEMVGAGAGRRGVLVVEGRSLRWEGPCPAGIGRSIGRKQLAEVVGWLSIGSTFVQ